MESIAPKVPSTKGSISIQVREQQANVPNADKELSGSVSSKEETSQVTLQPSSNVKTQDEINLSHEDICAEEIKRLMLIQPDISIKECISDVRRKFKKRGLSHISPSREMISAKLKEERKIQGIVLQKPKSLKITVKLPVKEEIQKQNRKRSRSLKIKNKRSGKKYFKVLGQMVNDDPDWEFKDLLSTLKGAFTSSLSGRLPRNFPDDNEIRSYYKSLMKSPDVGGIKKFKRSGGFNKETESKYLKELRLYLWMRDPQPLTMQMCKDMLIEKFSIDSKLSLPDDFPSNVTISRRLSYAKKRYNAQGSSTPSTIPSNTSHYSQALKEILEEDLKFKLATIKSKLEARYRQEDGTLPEDFPSNTAISQRCTYIKKHIRTQKKEEFFDYVESLASSEEKFDVNAIAELLKTDFDGMNPSEFLQSNDVDQVLALFRNEDDEVKSMKSEKGETHTRKEEITSETKISPSIESDDIVRETVQESKQNLVEEKFQENNIPNGDSQTQKETPFNMYNTLSVLDLRCSFVGDTWCYPQSVLSEDGTLKQS